MELKWPFSMETEIVESENFSSLSGPCILGIDEAGRGPMIGPIVFGCAITPLVEKQNLDKIGIDDSKKLKAAKRTSIYEKFKEIDNLSFAYIAHSARALSAYNFSLINPRNLNQISHQSAVDLIQNALNNNIDIVEVYVDTVGPKEVYRDYLQKIFPTIKIFVEEKADGLFKIVGAASIVAKVNRDLLLEGHVFDEAEMSRPISGFGSGYTDEGTMRYMHDAFDPVFGFSTLVRFGWKNVNQVIKDGGVNCKWIDSNAPKTIKSFFHKIGADPEIKKCQFFKKKGLKHISKF